VRFSADMDFTGLTEYNIPIWDALTSCSLNLSHDYKYPFFLHLDWNIQYSNTKDHTLGNVI